MSISPAQSVNEVAAMAPASPRTPASLSPAPVAAKEATPEPAPAPSAPLSSELSTETRFDNRRHVYYEVVNRRTGDVVCEIPPEVIRKLGEDFSKLPDGLINSHTVDVKS